MTPESKFEFGVKSLNDKYYALAMECFKQAIEAGYIEAYNPLAFMYFNGLGVKKSYKTAFNCYQIAAERGNAKAQDNLATMYAKGQGTPADGRAAMKWYAESAKQGYPQALNNLACGCCDGLGGYPIDYKKAKEFYEIAMQANYYSAYYNLGLMYLLGQGVDKDIKKAYELIKEAADHEIPNAMSTMGEFYWEGMPGVARKNIKKALEYFKKAHEQGYPYATFMLGLAYDTGKGVKQNTKTAVKYYKIAAEKGEARAQVFLACNYLDGEGVKKDLTKAKSLLIKAAKQGDDDACYLLREHKDELGVTAKELRKYPCLKEWSK